jgi:hypothetical protein
LNSLPVLSLSGRPRRLRHDRQAALIRRHEVSAGGGLTAAEQARREQVLPAGRPDPKARIKIYPDSAHGFLFQHHADFAADVEAFLSEPPIAGTGYAPFGRPAGANASYPLTAAGATVTVIGGDALRLGCGSAVVGGDGNGEC